MTLRFDLELAHLARRMAPRALLRGGRHGGDLSARAAVRARAFRSGGARRGRAAAARARRRGCARASRSAALPARPNAAPTARSSSCRSARSTAAELRDAIFSIPYEKMPYRAYWERLESAYRLGALPSKAAREARLAEIRSVRLITLNYCPMGCTFCSATNFLHEAQGSVASIARLDADDCVRMIERIVAAHPLRAHDHLPGRHLRLHQGPAHPAAVRGDRRRQAARCAAARSCSSSAPTASTPCRPSASPPCGARDFACSASASRASRATSSASSTRRRSIAHIEPTLTRGARARHHAVPRHHPELAARRASQTSPPRCARRSAGCGRDARSAFTRT